MEGSRDKQEESNKGCRGIKSIVETAREEKGRGKVRTGLQTAKQTFNH